MLCIVPDTFCCKTMSQQNTLSTSLERLCSPFKSPVTSMNLTLVADKDGVLCSPVEGHSIGRVKRELATFYKPILVKKGAVVG